LNHREVDLDLVEPGSMGRKVDQAQVGPLSLPEGASPISHPDERSHCPRSKTPYLRRRRAPLS
jgi:hypothetical protein